MKRILAILVSVCVIFAMIPASAFATTTTYTATLTGVKAEETYKGANYAPVITVTEGNLETSGVVLNSGNNYTDNEISATWTKDGEAIGENPFKDAGTYTATVNKGGEGIGTVSFKINPIDLTGADVTISYIKEGVVNEAPFNTKALGQPGGIGSAQVDKTEINGENFTADGILTVKAGEYTLQHGQADDYTSTLTYYAKSNTAPAKVRVDIQGDGTNVINSRFKDYIVTTVLEGETANNTFKLSTEPSVTEATSATAKLPDQTYTGSAIKISGLKAFYKKADATWEELPTEYYDLEYENNTKARTTATVKAVAKGIYSGTSAERKFDIVPKSISGVTVTAKDIALEGTVDVKVTDGTMVLTEGTDYDLVIKDSAGEVKTKDVAKAKEGTYKVTVKAKENGNYTGEKKDAATFTVTEGLTGYSIKVNSKANDSTTYTGNVNTPTVLVYQGASTTALSTSEYDLKFRNSAGVESTTTKDAGTYDIVITKKTGTDAGKKAVFEDKWVVNPIYFTTSTYYTSSYTQIIGLGDSYPYTGRAIEPVITVICGGKTLTKGTDYTVTYNNNTNISTTYSYATVTVAGKGNYSGTVSEKFYIVKSTIDVSTCTAEFTKGSSSTYTTTGFVPAITVKNSTANGGGYLKEGTDYTVTYKDPAGKTAYIFKDVGLYTATIKGTGAYTGTKTIYHSIVGTDISNYTVTLKETSVKETGKAIVPEVTSVAYGTLKLTANTDYKISYETSAGAVTAEIVKPGKYRIVATGVGKYSGTTYSIFEVVAVAPVKTNEQIAAETVDAYKMKASSVKTSSKNVQVTISMSEGDLKDVADLGYTVKYKFYRSEKKSSGYKAMVEKTSNVYTNTKGEKGTKYYYKARVMVYDKYGALVTKSELKQCTYASRTWSK